MLASLSDRLAATFKGLRGKGRLSEADVDATVREIRTALLEADVALPVVRQFTDHGRFVSINKVQLLDVPGDPARDEIWR